MSNYPVSRRCPHCGHPEFTKRKPNRFLAFVADRVCNVCQTRYVPPTPVWQAAALILFGLLILLPLGVATLLEYREGRVASVRDLQAGLLGAVIIGTLCILAGILSWKSIRRPKSARSETAPSRESDLPPSTALSPARTGVPTGPYFPALPPAGRTTDQGLPGSETDSERRLGDYDVLDELGQGGMGMVYLARQRSANRIVALKVIRTDRLESMGVEQRRIWLERFRTEAQATARIDHPHVVPVFDVGTFGDSPYYSMRYIEGRSLAIILRSGPVPGEQAVRYLEPAARAVHCAHTHGIIHRDLKPRNILVDNEERPYVVDFGLAKWHETVQEMTITGDCLGTPPFMSPEQARDAAHVTSATDVYSLGATLYALLTGRPPFQGATAAEVLLQVISHKPVAPGRLNPAVDRDLETICLKCLEKEPVGRYPSAQALADDLNRFLRGEPIAARPVNVWERTVKWVRRRPVAAAFCSAFLSLFLVTAAFYLLKLRAEGQVIRQELERSQERDEAARVLGETVRNETKAKESAVRQAELQVLMSRYGRDMELAYLDLQKSRMRQAEAVLKAWPEHMRDWEWNFLQAACLRNSGEAICTLTHQHPVRALAFNVDGTRLVSGSSSVAGNDGGAGEVRVWDIGTGHPLWGADVPLRVAAVAFSPDGRQVVTAATDAWGAAAQRRYTKESFSELSRPIRVRDAATGSDLFQIEMRDAPSHTAFAPDGRRFAIFNDPRWAIRTYSTDPGGEVRATSLRRDLMVELWECELVAGPVKQLRSFLSLPQSGDVPTAGGPNNLNPALRSNQDLVQPAQFHSVRCLAYSPDGRRLAAATHCEVVDVKQETLPSLGKDIGIRRPGGATVGGRGSLGPDTGKGRRVSSNTVWVGHEFRNVEVYETETTNGTVRTTTTRSWTGRVFIWDTATGRQIFCDADNRANIHALAFNRDGTHLVWAWGKPDRASLAEQAVGATQGESSLDQKPKPSESLGGVRLWDELSGSPPMPVPGCVDTFLCLALTPNGRRWVGGDASGRVRFFDSATGQELLTLAAHNKPVHALLFSRDGSRLASASADGTVKIWSATHP